MIVTLLFHNPTPLEALSYLFNVRLKKRLRDLLVPSRPMIVQNSFFPKRYYFMFL